MSGAGHLGALFGFAAGHVVAVVAVSPLRGVRAVRSDEARALSPKLIHYGLPLAITLLGTTTVDFADRLLIAWMMGPSYVGPYAAGYDLAMQSIGAVTNILFLAAFPAVTRAYELGGDAAAGIHMRSLAGGFIAVGLPAAAGFALLSRDIANVFLGESFRGQVVPVMPVLAVSLWVAGFKSFYLDVVFQLRRVTRYQAYVALFMAATNIVANLALLPRYGLMGAAWATFAAFGAGAIASYLLGRAYMSVYIAGVDFLKSGAACALMALPLLLSRPATGLGWLVGKVAVGAGVYIGCAWVLDLASTRAWLARQCSTVRGRV
jgi:O-antigen/teichoic acid export membrane protein